MIIKLALRIWTDFGSATTIQRQSNNHSHQMTTTPKTQINFANIKWQIFDKEGGGQPGVGGATTIQLFRQIYNLIAKTIALRIRPDVGGATTIQARNCPLLLPINPHTLLCCCTAALLLLYSSALILCCCTAVLLLWTILPFCSYMQSAALLCHSTLINDPPLCSADTTLYSVPICSNLPAAGAPDLCDALNFFKIRVSLSLLST